ncbi:MAG: hypothetical protein AMXMBFR48_23500 [Ignavibacteriales bacterium]
MKPGSRKFTGFLLTLLSFSAVAILALFRSEMESSVLPSFVFQLASAYGIICGLFFGSNVLVHYAKKGASGSEKNPD